MAKKKIITDNIEGFEKEEIIKSKAYNDMLKTIENPWIFPETSNEELKKIAKDISDGKIFCDRHCNPNMSISSIFMPILFMGIINWPTEDTRENKLIKIFLKDKEADYKKRYEKWFKNIGFVYEYLSEAGPLAINNYPMFFSCRFLSKEDTEKMLKYYDEYMKLKEEIDEKFKNI